MHEVARISSHQCAFFAAKWHIRFMEGKEGLSVRGLTTAASISITATCAVAAHEGLPFEYRTVIRTIDRDNLTRLSVALRQWENVRASRIFPTGD